ncbi:hypothetical protein [Chryseobacterium kwangjuense]|uniref:Uncharacterized protein n=1 Tax=Chryseobacterium kwangjuense TaxID=267125 RepID=A0A135WEV2_9FLAO|nr:hypothetical protein [Chryseobacterium kwangjuense]KXH83426.1 hypothetical protein AU378_13600 [Chryseobacterium kwangjuense]
MEFKIDKKVKKGVKDNGRNMRLRNEKFIRFINVKMNFNRAILGLQRKSKIDLMKLRFTRLLNHWRSQNSLFSLKY